MISKGRFRCTRALNASTASNPFSAISTVLVLLEDLDGQLLLRQIVLGKKDVEYHVVCCRRGTDGTQLQGRMSAKARSCTLTGVVTSELMLLSKHHFIIICQHG